MDRMSERPYRITVVCWGNICRSPMAEYLLREALERAGLGDRVVVDSAGTSSEELGSGMHPRTAAVMRRNGHVDSGWSEHMARAFDPAWFDEVDLVLPFDPDAVEAGTLGMDDPWYGSDAAYDQTYAEVTAALPGIVEHVRSELERRSE